MIFFTSDTHWGHRNVIRYSNRPFGSVEEMDEEMVRRWNDKVSKRDVVYHLGDVAFMSPARAKPILDQLNGEIHLCIGNHDSKAIQQLDRWSSVEHYREISINGKHIVLSHYAHRVWNRSHRGSLMLYGHSHAALPGTNQSLDVGVDCWDYEPVTLNEILVRMSTLPPFRNQDHHRGNIENNV
jgi:calcineurin-like phosphoesterase family protein